MACAPGESAQGPLLPSLVWSVYFRYSVFSLQGLPVLLSRVCGSLGCVSERGSQEASQARAAQELRSTPGLHVLCMRAPRHVAIAVRAQTPRRPPPPPAEAVSLGFYPEPFAFSWGRGSVSRKCHRVAPCLRTVFGGVGIDVGIDVGINVGSRFPCTFR